MAVNAQEQVRVEKPPSTDLYSAKPSSPERTTAPRRFSLFLAIGALLLLTLGCSMADLLANPTPTPVPTRALAPTFTPTPGTVQTIIIVTPPHDGTPGVIIIPPGMDPNTIMLTPPTATPSATLTGISNEGGEQPNSPINGPGGNPITAVPTATPLPTATPTPTLTPTPFILVESGLASLRTGPGVEYSLVAQLGPNLPVPLIGRNPEGTWYQICCVDGATVWVPSTHVQVKNDLNGVALIKADASPPAPTPTIPPTPTGTPTLTPTPTRFPFERARGPEFFPTNNPFVTIWVKLYVGAPNGTDEAEAPAAGYFLKVKFEGADRPNTEKELPSTEQFSYSASPGAGNRVKYNYKYEYSPPIPTPPPAPTPTPDPVQGRIQLLGTGTWTVYVVDGAGNQLSDAVTFTGSPSNPNREIYIAWIRTR